VKGRRVKAGADVLAVEAALGLEGLRDLCGVVSGQELLQARQRIDDAQDRPVRVERDRVEVGRSQGRIS
jgi:hypothetical protein